MDEYSYIGNADVSHINGLYESYKKILKVLMPVKLFSKGLSLPRVITLRWNLIQKIPKKPQSKI